VPRPKRTEKDKYGETKQRYQIMLTETASLELDKVSEELGITRSELIERVIRQGLLSKVRLEPDEVGDDLNYQ
jgi:metal-responsive CopG/Arc/MetJ family transcriptional regulator